MTADKVETIIRPGQKASDYMKAKYDPVLKKSGTTVRGMVGKLDPTYYHRIKPQRPVD